MAQNTFSQKSKTSKIAVLVKFGGNGETELKKDGVDNVGGSS